MRVSAAVVRPGSSQFAVETVDLPEPTADQLLVKIVSCGVCHTDLTAANGANENAIILGHEGSGIVETVGAHVTGFRSGDHVVLSFDSCGVCPQCLMCQPAYCANFVSLNISGTEPDCAHLVYDSAGQPVSSRWFGQSSFASHSIVNPRSVVRVDPDIPLRLLGPLGCGIQTGAGTVLHGLRVRPGTSIAVFGAGAVGLSAIMAAKLSGALTIIAIDVKQARLDLALELGATHAIDGSDPDVVQRVAAASRGGVDYALDTTASPACIDAAIRSMTMGGRCALVGVGSQPVKIDPATLAGRSLSYHVEGDSVPQLFVPFMIELWQSGRFPFDKLVREYAFDQINTAAQDSLAGASVKPVILMPE